MSVAARIYAIPLSFSFSSFFFLFFSSGFRRRMARDKSVRYGSRHGPRDKKGHDAVLVYLFQRLAPFFIVETMTKAGQRMEKVLVGNVRGEKSESSLSLSLSRPLLLRLRETVLDRSNISLSPNLLLLLSPSPPSSPSPLDPLSVPALPIVCSFRSNKRRRDMNRFATRDLFLPSKK